VLVLLELTNNGPWEVSLPKRTLDRATRYADYLYKVPALRKKFQLHSRRGINCPISH